LAWDSPDAVVQAALKVLEESQLLPNNELSAPRLLAIERWHRIHLAFDIFNNNYDFNTAHLANQNDFPVIAVYLEGHLHGDRNKALVAPSSLQKDVNETIRHLHDMNGWETQPPFFGDHANGNVPTYWHPRSLIRAKKTSL
jgi:hypothetical protein